jgi:hypothetical protein
VQHHALMLYQLLQLYGIKYLLTKREKAVTVERHRRRVAISKKKGEIIEQVNLFT